MQWIVIIIVVSIFHGGVFGYEGCSVSYGKRSCQHRMINGVVVVCNGHGVETRVPKNLPQDTLYLSLVNFNFSRPLTSGDFTRLTTVQCLSIIRSGLVGIETDAFSQFHSLYELHLEGTQINESCQLNFLAHDNNNNNFRPEFFQLSRSPYLTAIDDDDFQASGKIFQSLRTLRLDHNRLLRVSAGFLTALKNLEILDLSHNRLAGLPWETFVHLVGLTQLFLAGNRIQTVPEPPMRPVFFAVKQLTIAGNPLHCNCRLRWLRDFYLRDVTDRQSDVDQVYCRGPRYAHVAQVPPATENFRCFSPRDPVITWTEVGDGRVEVNCSAQADPAPTLTLTLTLTPTTSGNSPRKVMVIPPSENMAELSTSTPQILLEPGLVTCEAVNSEGSRKVVGHVGPEVNSDSKATRIGRSLLAILLSPTVASLLNS